MSRFEVSNFLAQSKAEWAKTNFDAQIDAVYLQYGAQAFPDAKTPADAKAKIRDLMIRQRALTDARAQANDFASTVFNLSPTSAGNLATVAKQKGLTRPDDRAVQRRNRPAGIHRAGRLRQDRVRSDAG